MQLEEALNERTDEEMDLSDSDSDVDENGSPRGKKMRVDQDQDKTVNQLKVSRSCSSLSTASHILPPDKL